MVIDRSVQRRGRVIALLEKVEIACTRVPPTVSEKCGNGAILVAYHGDLFKRSCHIAQESGAAVIPYGSRIAPSQVVDALEAGAVDFLAWPIDAQTLVDRLALAAERDRRRKERDARANASRALIDRLSPRERQVLAGLADGLPNKLIARELGISPRTVEIHRSNMLGKLGSCSSAAAVALAVEAELSAWRD